MPTERQTWKYNMRGLPPVRILAKFQAGASQPIVKGDLLELSGGNFIPLATDKAMAATVAVADCNITSGDLAGYYPIIVPSLWDVFELDLDAADDLDRGTALYVSASQVVTDTAGTNVLGHVVDHGGFPKQQGYAHLGDATDRSTTIRNSRSVLFTIKESASYMNALQGDDVV